MVSTLKLTKIQIPNSDSDVISLDASTGNITLNKNLGGTSITIQGENTNTTNLQQGLAKAWANYHAPDPANIRDDFNITSLTDNGTGYFTLTLTNSMNNNDYSRVAAGGENADTGGNRVVGLRLPSTGSFNLATFNTGGSASDVQDTCVAIFGDLA